jgi:hypothetical protein
LSPTCPRLAGAHPRATIISSLPCGEAAPARCTTARNSGRLNTKTRMVRRVDRNRTHYDRGAIHGTKALDREAAMLDSATPATSPFTAEERRAIAQAGETWRHLASGCTLDQWLSLAPGLCALRGAAKRIADNEGLKDYRKTFHRRTRCRLSQTTGRSRTAAHDQRVDKLGSRDPAPLSKPGQAPRKSRQRACFRTRLKRSVHADRIVEPGHQGRNRACRAHEQISGRTPRAPRQWTACRRKSRGPYSRRGRRYSQRRGTAGVRAEQFGRGTAASRGGSITEQGAGNETASGVA